MSVVKRTNLTTNPVGANFAATTGMAFTRCTGAVNTGFVRCTVTDALVAAFGQRVQWAGVPLNVGGLFQVYAEGRSDVTVPNLATQLLFLNGGFAQVGPAFMGATTPVNATSGSFTPLGVVTGVAPAGAVFAVGWVGIPGTTARSLGQIFDVRRFLIEEGTSGDYFDGSFSDTDQFDYEWAGTAELSASTQTSKLRREVKQGSLTQAAVRAATM